jgi:hypothetical protein
MNDFNTASLLMILELKQWQKFEELNNLVIIQDFLENNLPKMLTILCFGYWDCKIHHDIKKGSFWNETTLNYF